MTINYLPITTWDAFQVIVANWENNANECMYGLVELLNNFISFDSVDRKTPKINF
jgi:hypothetical protein